MVGVAFPSAHIWGIPREVDRLPERVADAQRRMRAGGLRGRGVISVD